MPKRHRVHPFLGHRLKSKRSLADLDWDFSACGSPLEHPAKRTRLSIVWQVPGTLPLWPQLQQMSFSECCCRQIASKWADPHNPPFTKSRCNTPVHTVVRPRLETPTASTFFAREWNCMLQSSRAHSRHHLHKKKKNAPTSSKRQDKTEILALFCSST